MVMKLKQKKLHVGLSLTEIAFPLILNPSILSKAAFASLGFLY